MTTPAHGPPPAPGDSDQRCSTEELLDAWMSIIRGHKHVNRILACHVEQETGLPAPDFFVLAKLRRNSDPAVPLSTLARELAFSSGGFTKLADRLQQAGLIRREPSPCDRRVTNAVLTPAGRAAADRALAIYCAALRELVLRHLGTDGLRVMVSQMSRLRDLAPSFVAERGEPETTAQPVLDDLLGLPGEASVPGPCWSGFPIGGRPARPLMGNGLTVPVTAKVLTQRLRQLERRRAHRAYVPRRDPAGVEYQITDLGRTLSSARTTCC